MTGRRAGWQGSATPGKCWRTRGTGRSHRAQRTPITPVRNGGPRMRRQTWGVEAPSGILPPQKTRKAFRKDAHHPIRLIYTPQQCSAAPLPVTLTPIAFDHGSLQGLRVSA